jgi:hypothetical protein
MLLKRLGLFELLSFESGFALNRSKETMKWPPHGRDPR